MLWTNLNFATTRITIKNGKIPDEFSGFRIAQISDLHNHQWGDRLTRRLEKEKPDIIVITGDLVDSSHTDIKVAMDFVTRAVKISPVYYVTGNHELWLDDYSDFAAMLSDSGVNIIDDKSQWIEKGPAKINISGVQDPNFVDGDDSVQKSVVKEKLESLLDKNCYNIVLCHRPELFEGYVAVGADLIFTGHAHGGQVRLPFIGGLVAPNQGVFPKYTQGVYSQNGTDMVVSRGLGNSIIPVRFNNMPELIIVTLEKSEF